MYPYHENRYPKYYQIFYIILINVGKALKKDGMLDTMHEIKSQNLKHFTIRSGW